VRRIQAAEQSNSTSLCDTLDDGVVRSFRGLVLNTVQGRSDEVYFLSHKPAATISAIAEAAPAAQSEEQVVGVRVGNMVLLPVKRKEGSWYGAETTGPGIH
jgi:hypothetical protein